MSESTRRGGVSEGTMRQPSFTRLKYSFLFGESEETRTLASARPTYRISNPDPLNRLGTPPCIKNRSPDLQPDLQSATHFFRKTVIILLAFCVFEVFAKSAIPRGTSFLFFTVPL